MGDIVIYPQGRRGVTASQELAASPRRNSGANRKEEGKQGRRGRDGRGEEEEMWLKIIRETKEKPPVSN